MRTTVKDPSPCRSVHRIFRGRVSHRWIGAGAIFAAASISDPRNRDQRRHFPRADPDKTGTLVPKSVIVLLRNWHTTT